MKPGHGAAYAAGMLETRRLTLIPLDARRLELWHRDTTALEEELGCVYDAEPPEGPFLVIIKGQLEIIKNNSGSWLWNTFWLLRDRESAVIVGAACFKGASGGEAEIGYAAGENHRKKGYITEAVLAMCEWAFDQPGITAITAETETWNRDSHGVLARCGFERCDGGAGDTFWWRLKNPYSAFCSALSKPSPR